MLSMIVLHPKIPLKLSIGILHYTKCLSFNFKVYFNDTMLMVYNKHKQLCSFTFQPNVFLSIYTFKYSTRSFSWSAVTNLLAYFEEVMFTSSIKTNAQSNIVYVRNSKYLFNKQKSI